MPSQVITLIAVSAVMFLVIGGLAFISHYYTLDGIKSKTVGDGQHGTARWATKQEIHRTYHLVRYDPQAWRRGKELPKVQGIMLAASGGTRLPSSSRLERKTSPFMWSGSLFRSTNA